METEVLKGKCDFRIVEKISNKTGKPYKALKLSFNGYELSNQLFVNEDQIYIISQKLKV